MKAGNAVVVGKRETLDGHQTNRRLPLARPGGAIESLATAAQQQHPAQSTALFIELIQVKFTQRTQIFAGQAVPLMLLT